MEIVLTLEEFLSQIKKLHYILSGADKCRYLGENGRLHRMGMEIHFLHETFNCSCKCNSANVSLNHFIRNDTFIIQNT